MKIKTLLFFILYCVVQSAKAQTFRVVIMADVKDRKIGFSCTKDLAVMDSVFNKIADNIDYQYKSIVINNKDFSKAVLEKVISELKVESQDVLVFYYTGHGFTSPNQSSDFPVLYLPDSEETTLEAIHKKLKSKGARLCISLGDCCNNIMLANQMPVIQPLQFRSIFVENDILRTLFKDSKGDVLICSAKKGERALCHPSVGGWYSASWQEALLHAQNSNNTITWETLLQDAERRLQDRVKIENQIGKQHSNWKVALTSGKPDNKTTAKITFSDMNRFLSTLADESIDFAVREKLLQQKKNLYFMPQAEANEYITIIDNNMSPTDIDDFLDRVLVNSSLIKQINVVENLSLFSKDGRYQRITVQEVR